MKNKMRCFTTFLAVIFAFVFVSGICASDSWAKEYRYKVKVYAGNQGHFSSGKVWTEKYKPGQRVYISAKKLGFKLDNKKYYVRGFRIAGHDNDETSGYQSLNFRADADVSYEIAYGIKGAMVRYKVEYVDEDSNKLRKDDEFLGMPGDKPVVAYRYVEGYRPQAYNMGKTLSENESENVFTFVYEKISGDESGDSGSGSGNDSGNAGGNGNGTDGAGNGGAGGNGTAGGQAAGPSAPGTVNNPADSDGADTASSEDGTAQDIGDSDTPLDDGPQQYTDIDDEDTPLAVISDHKGITAAIIAAIAAVVLLIIFMSRRKKKQN